ncbi:hypothetical protein BD408DRAFT_444431 [Parasitella parasitica]|nr:hypothetical protein BD408DRAFT_444431 [Parasitella parasitica]
MPPNVQQQEEQASFIDHFWSKDKSGMETLLNYMNSTHQDLEMIHEIYVQRSILESEFGEKLLQLYSKNKGQEDAGGVSAAYGAVSAELNRTATTHLDLSDALATQVAAKCHTKLTEYRELLSKWTASLNELYQHRKEKILQLLKVRAQYTKEHDISKGKSTPTLEALKNEYKDMAIKVNEIAQEWNSAWEEACEVMEAMEKDRVEFLKCNVWDYANQVSATLLIQDECCENIRQQLEKCHVDQEIEKCISLFATGTEIPTTKEYVDELWGEQKKKNQAERTSIENNPPKPPSKSARQQGVQSQLKQVSKSAQKDQHAQEQEENVAEKVSIDPRQKSKQESLKKNELEGAKKKQQQQLSEASTASTTDEKRNTLTSRNGFNNQIKGHVSKNMESTASRGQIKRKPLDESLMKQAWGEMSLTRQQSKVEPQNPAYSSTRGDNPAYKPEASGSLDILLKSFEKPKSTVTEDAKSVPHPNAVVSDQAKSRRQPSEYKPDAGSIPSRRLAHRTNHDAQEPSETYSTNTSLRSTPEPLTPPVTAPKSPRPPAQQIFRDVQNSLYSSPAQQQNSPDHNLGYQQSSHPQQFQPTRSPMIQPMKSPMMQPMRSPMMQPIHSPMMQPMHSPMMQPMHSPMMQPMHSPMMQPMHSSMIPPIHSPMMQPMQSLRGTLPPPISTNLELSPSMSYATLRSVSPGGVLPPPTNGTHPIPSRPSQYADRRPIRFWARAKYDYDGQDDELTFKANNLMGILEADVAQESWWFGAVYDEYRQTWSTAASIPSNFMKSA